MHLMAPLWLLALCAPLKPTDLLSLTTQSLAVFSLFHFLPARPGVSVLSIWVYFLLFTIISHLKHLKNSHGAKKGCKNRVCNIGPLPERSLFDGTCLSLLLLLSSCLSVCLSLCVCVCATKLSFSFCFLLFVCFIFANPVHLCFDKFRRKSGKVSTTGSCQCFFFLH